MSTVLRWIGFGGGVVIAFGTVVGVMKTFIVPRRSWSLLPALIARNGFRLFHAVGRRLGSFDLADRFLGFLAPTVIIATLASFLISFVVAFALLLLPWGQLTLGEALHESGSSIFTLGFLSSDEAVPLSVDILGAATGMIFVALTIGYLPTMYAEVTKREVLVKQLEGWTGTPSWGPLVLARFSSVGAIDELPALFRAWDAWAAQVADTHMKYPVLTHFRLPRSKNHWLLAFLAVMDAAALSVALQPDANHAPTHLFLRQGRSCLRSVAYPMRRVGTDGHEVGITRTDFDSGLELILAAGFPAPANPDEVWARFADLRSHYAHLVYQLTYWTIAAPAPWSGERPGFPGLTAPTDVTT